MEQPTTRAIALTWNVKGEHQFNNESTVKRDKRVLRALSALAKHLSSFDRWVATLVEPPRNLASLFSSCSSGPFTEGPTLENRIAVLASSNVKFADPLETICTRPGMRKRSMSFYVESLLSKRVLVAAVHFPSALDRKKEESRASDLESLCQAIRSRWNGIEDFIVMGDFNANPWQSEIGSPRGIWAIRDRTHLNTRATSIHDQLPPLYNPIWRYLGEAKAPPHGTYDFGRFAENATHWHWLDQILVSQGLADAAQSSVQIHTHLDAQPVADQAGRPSSDFSDHLPVSVTFGGKHDRP